VADLVIGRRLVGSQFEPVERRFAGHRRAVLAVCDQLAGQHRHDRVVPQLVVIDDIFIAQRNAKDALADHCRHGVLDQLLRAAVAETPRKPIDQPDRLVRCPSNSPPASEVILPPSKAATTERPSTRANPNKSALHSVCIGTPPDPETNRCYNTIFSEAQPRCTPLL
jgi:hypothetical protein